MHAGARHDDLCICFLDVTYLRALVVLNRSPVWTSKTLGGEGWGDEAVGIDCSFGDAAPTPIRRSTAYIAGYPSRRLV